MWASVDDFEATDRRLTKASLHCSGAARAVLSLSARAARVAARTSLRFVQIEMSPPDRALMAEFP